MTFHSEVITVIVRFSVEDECIEILHNRLCSFCSMNGEISHLPLKCWLFYNTATFEVTGYTLEDAVGFIKNFIEDFVIGIRSGVSSDSNVDWREQVYGKKFEIKGYSIHTHEDGLFDYYKGVRMSDI